MPLRLPSPARRTLLADVASGCELLHQAVATAQRASRASSTAALALAQRSEGAGDGAVPLGALPLSPCELKAMFREGRPSSGSAGRGWAAARRAVRDKRWKLIDQLGPHGVPPRTPTQGAGQYMYRHGSLAPWQWSNGLDTTE